jgi:hypothetical protein
MRDFSVFVTGIAAFVGDYRRVLAVDAARPTTMNVTDENGKTSEVTVPAHFPYLRLPTQHIDDATASAIAIGQDWDVSAAPGAFPPDGGPNPFNRSTLVQFLHFHEVVLPDSESPADVDMTPLNANGIPIVDQKEGQPPPDATSALWLPSMNNLGTPKKRIDSKHITANPVEIAAYIRFPKGRVSTASATNFKFVSVSPADGKAAGPFNRAVAQLMVCTMKVPDEAFTVKCRDYRTNDQKSFDINFKAGIPQPWMVFACTSLEDALQLPSVEEKFGVDYHFRLVYNLAEGTVTDADVALPKSISPPEVGADEPLGAGRCVPPLFDGGETGGI